MFQKILRKMRRKMFRKKAHYEEAPHNTAGVLNACGFWGILVLLWFIAGELHLLNPAMLPKIQDVWGSFWQLFDPPADETLFSKAQVFKYYSFADNLEVTALRILISCGIGIPTGVVLAARAAISSRMRPSLYSFTWWFHSAPTLLLLIPAAFLGFVGSQGAIAVGALAAFSMTFITMYGSLSGAGFQGVIDGSKALGFNRVQTLFLIILPSENAVIAFSTTLILAVRTASGGVAIAELFSTSSGLGTLFKIALTNDRQGELIVIGLWILLLIGIGPLLGGIYLFFSEHIWKGLFCIGRLIFCRDKK